MSCDAVLIVDDDPDYRDLVRLYVERVGAAAFEAEDCARAVELLRVRRDRIALVLLDYWMPNMAPPTCARCIRELVLPSTRVVLVTAAVDAQARAEEVGIANWLPKPIDLDRLRAIVQEAMRASSPTDVDLARVNGRGSAERQR